MGLLHREEILVIVSLFDIFHLANKAENLFPYQNKSPQQR